MVEEKHCNHNKTNSKEKERRDLSFSIICLVHILHPARHIHDRTVNLMIICCWVYVLGREKKSLVSKSGFPRFCSWQISLVLVSGTVLERLLGRLTPGSCMGTSAHHWLGLASFSWSLGTSRGARTPGHAG